MTEIIAKALHWLLFGTAVCSWVLIGKMLIDVFQNKRLKAEVQKQKIEWFRTVFGDEYIGDNLN